ncbi:MAG: alpha-glucosidase/alpha-galactosidase [Alphaproteobacteria bacterium]
MTRISIIGAGSTVFLKNIVGDILLNEPLADCALALHDIDPERLATSRMVAEKIRDTVGAGARITATIDRREALAGADYVILMMQVGGYESTVTDFEIPKKYGLRQTIADTLGVGGIMRGLRTVPVLLDMAADMRELCPGALVLNYVNPMAINCWALGRLAPDMRVIGLCHSVQATAAQLARDLGEDPADIAYTCAGINHMAFYTRFEKKAPCGPAEDLYPRLRELAMNGDVPDNNRVRYEVLKRTGYFVTESSEHFAEYVPWFIKSDRPDLIERFGIPLDEYIRRCETQVARWEEQARELAEATTIEVERSHECAAAIIRAGVTGEPHVVYGNVPNEGLIENLPEAACVEVPCVVDRAGVHPTRIGRLPPHLAALIQTNINVQALTVEALATGRKEHVYHAAMLDPHTAAELSLEDIWALVDDLLEAHRDRLPRLS